jgi:hypothetical protein
MVLVSSLSKFAPRLFFKVNRHRACNLGAPLQTGKAQSMAWKRSISPVAKKFKSQPSAGKIMLTNFSDLEGVILVHFTPKGETINCQIPIRLAQ